MSPLKAPSNLPELVKAAFARAKSNGDLTYYATQVTLLSPTSSPFQLRFSPALANKPTAPRPKNPSQKPFDPFEAPEQGPLFVAEVPPEHNLVLNKFAIVPEHFILATKSFKEQTHLLEAGDLAATLACIEAYHQYAARQPGDGGELFAFFNSGPHSGASQPHRHIQLLPMDQMKAGLENPERWDVLANTLTTEDGAARAPFRTFGAAIGPGISAEELHETYLRLYQQAVAAVKSHAAENGAKDVVVTDGGPDAAEISYNMAMTRSALVICPRVAEGATISNGDGGVVGKLSLNGTLLAGTALVKNQGEWDALRGDGVGDAALADVLSKIGVPTAGRPTEKI